MAQRYKRVITRLERRYDACWNAESLLQFRKRHPDTPLILMGYYNPIYIYGNDRFIADALAAGVDGLISRGFAA